MNNKLKKCVGKEGFQRINYLYQISNVLATQNKAGHVAALNYSNLAVNISKKTVQRLDIDIKRTICKRCRSLMIPGLTSRVRIKKKKVQHTCLKCQTMKIFETTNRDYVPWSQTDECLVELLDCSENLGSQNTNKNVPKNNKHSKEVSKQNENKAKENNSKQNEILTVGVNPVNSKGGDINSKTEKQTMDVDKNDKSLIS